MALAKFILLKSTNNNKYLRYRKEKDSKHAFLQFSQDEKEENAEIQYAKFEVQKSETAEGFVHIRCCYNNKYWVRKSGESKWIAAEANEPEEDQSKWSCTLFKVEHLGADVEGGAVADVAVDAEVDVQIPQITKPQKIRLVHSDQLGQHPCVAALSNTDHDLVIGEEGSRTTTTSFEDVFIAYDASFIFVLPDRVALTAHNGKYLAATPVGDVTFVEAKASDMGDHGVTHAVTQWPLWHHVHFECTAFHGQGHWKNARRYVDCIVLTEPSNQTPVHFIPIRLGANLLAIQESFFTPSRFLYCSWAEVIGMDFLLQGRATSINQSAIFQISEPVRFRQIRNMIYNLQDSRVYNVASVEKYRDERANATNVHQKGSIRVEYQVSETRAWEDSVSVTRSLSASMSVSIPFVRIDFGVELSHEQEQTITWGNEVTESRTVSYEQEVDIPPGKRVIVTVVATRALCDVPFTCQVQDIVADGEIRNYTKTDGRFTGANEFSFSTLIRQEDL